MIDVLPLGSVVSLKKGDKKIMIVGRLQREPGKQRIYDYAACLWPEGLIDSSHFYLFDQSDIDRLYYIGMQNEEEFLFRSILDEAYMTKEKSA